MFGGKFSAAKPLEVFPLPMIANITLLHAATPHLPCGDHCDPLLFVVLDLTRDRFNSVPCTEILDKGYRCIEFRQSPQFCPVFGIEQCSLLSIVSDLANETQCVDLTSYHNRKGPYHDTRSRLDHQADFVSDRDGRDIEFFPGICFHVESPASAMSLLQERWEHPPNG
jgi:hypothetical protein